MRINTFAISGIVLTCTCLILIFIILRGEKSKLLRLWVSCNLSLGLWGFASIFIALTKNYQESLFWWKLGSIGIISLPPFFLHLAFTLCNIEKRRVLLLVYIQACVFILLNFTKLLISDLNFVFNSFYYPKITGFIYPLMYLFWISIVVYGSWIIFITYRNTQGLKRRQLLYFLIGTSIGFTGGIVNFFPVFGIRLYPVSNFSGPIYIGIATYAIIKYRLMDIKVALTRAGIFIIVYALVLGIPLGLAGWGKVLLQESLGSNWYWAPLILAIILATSGPFIYLALQQRAEKIILKAQKAYQDALREISFTMITIKDIDRLLNTIVLKVVGLVNLSWAAIYLIDEKQKKFLLKHQKIASGKVDFPKEFTLDSPLAKCLYESREPLMGEEIGFSTLKIGLAVPCFMDSVMIGFLLLGDKPKNAIYTQDDVNVFTVLANQTALAIENCQFYAQEREHHHLLRVSSLDRQMASMAHEIDNPNQALLGCLYSLEMNLDDVKDIIPQEKLDHLKEKISKARFHTSRISKMIGAVREFSKPTTGELAVVKLQWILEDFFSIVQPQIKHEGVTFNQEILQEDVWLKVNKVEIEQVLVNLCTNSVQAIIEMAMSGINIPEWKKEIILKIYKKDKETNILRIDFSDTGSGIKKEILEDIFLDFVTTKASSVGTGLGLAISRKIMHKHNGKIWAESEGDNKGATFHLEIPIPVDISEEERRKAEESRGNKNKGATWFT